MTHAQWWPKRPGHAPQTAERAWDKRHPYRKGVWKEPNGSWRPVVNVGRLPRKTDHVVQLICPYHLRAVGGPEYLREETVRWLGVWRGAPAFVTSWTLPDGYKRQSVDRVALWWLGKLSEQHELDHPGHKLYLIHLGKPPVRTLNRQDLYQLVVAIGDGRRP